MGDSLCRNHELEWSHRFPFPSVMRQLLLILNGEPLRLHANKKNEHNYAEKLGQAQGTSRIVENFLTNVCSSCLKIDYIKLICFHSPQAGSCFRAVQRCHSFFASAQPLISTFLHIALFPVISHYGLRLSDHHLILKQVKFSPE